MSSVSLDPNFLWVCLQSIRDNQGKPMMPDFKFVGQKLGIKPHTAYCRYNAARKAMPADGGVDGVEIEYKAAAGTNNKRKRGSPKKGKGVEEDEEDDEEVLGVKSKRGRPAKGAERILANGKGKGKGKGRDAEDEDEVVVKEEEDEADGEVEDGENDEDEA